MGNAPAAPSIKIGGLGTFDLQTAHVERKLPAKVAEKVGKVTATVRRWATMTTTYTEAIIGEDDNGDDVAILLDSTRYSVKVPSPIVKGKPAPLPLSVTVNAFGEAPRSLALAPFIGEPRKDGTPRSYVYGALDYPRPSGAVYVLHVKVTPSADNSEWRVASILAQ